MFNKFESTLHVFTLTVKRITNEENNAAIAFGIQCISFLANLSTHIIALKDGDAEGHEGTMMPGAR